MKTFSRAERKELHRLANLLKPLDPFKAAHVSRVIEIDGLTSKCTLSAEYENNLTEERRERTVLLLGISQ